MPPITKIHIVSMVKMPILFVLCYVLTTSNAMACMVVDGQFLTNIYRCINSMLDKTATEHIEPILEHLGNFVASICILAIIIYGYRVSFGVVRQLRNETVIIILKLVVIATFCLNWELLSNYRSMLIGFSEATSGIFLSGFAEGAGCGAAAAGESTSIFSLLDCTINVIINDEEANANNTLTIISVAGLLLMIPGGIGLYILLGLFAVFFALIATAVYMILIHLQSMFAITILITLVPIMLPLILIKQYESNITRFLHLLIYYSILPIVMSAYLGLMLAVLSYEVQLMQLLLVDGYEVTQDPNRPNNIVIVSTEAGQESLQAARDNAKNPLKKGHATSSKYSTGFKKVKTTLKRPKDSRWWITRQRDALLKGAKDGIVTLYNGVKKAIKDMSELEIEEYAKRTALYAGARMVGLDAAITGDHLSWKQDKIYLFILYLFLLFITFRLMYDFLKQLPMIIEKFIAGDNNTSIQRRGMLGGDQEQLIKNAGKPQKKGQR